MADSQSVRSEVDAAADGVPEVHIYGPPVSDYSIFPTSSLQLMCGLGEIDGQDVMVPYLQLSISRAQDESGEGPRIEALKATVPFENLAFLLMDMTSDLSRAASKLDRLAAGAIAPEPLRIAYSADCMRRASDALLKAAATLERLARTGEETHEPPAPSPVRGKSVPSKASRTKPGLRAPRKRPSE